MSFIKSFERRLWFHHVNTGELFGSARRSAEAHNRAEENLLRRIHNVEDLKLSIYSAMLSGRLTDSNAHERLLLIQAKHEERVGEAYEKVLQTNNRLPKKLQADHRFPTL